MAQSNPIKNYYFSGYRLNIIQRLLYSPSNHVIALSSRAFDCLHILILNRGKTISKYDLMAKIWQNQIVEENNLNQAIFSLRKALEDSKTESQFIRTIQGQGYSFIAEVEEERISEPAQSSRTEEKTDPIEKNYTSESHLSTEKFPWPKAATVLLLSIIVGTSIFFFLRNNTSASNVVTPSSSEDKLSATTPLYPNLIPNSLAVLPFTALNPAPENELFALTLHDELITQLSKVGSLKVITRNSVLTMANTYPSATELGKRLGVETVMSGTILFLDDEAHVNLQLEDPSTGIALWSSKYSTNTQDLADIISSQGKIAKEIALSLNADIQPHEETEINALPTSSFEAYRYHLASKKAYFNQEFEQTLLLSKQALDLDPEYYDALFLYSNVNAVLMGRPLSGMSMQDHIQLALDSAELLIVLRPNEPEGYIQKSLVYAASKEWDKVAIEYNRLIKMDASLSKLNLLAPTQMSLGNFDEAIDILESNLKFDPVNLFGRGFLLAAYESAGHIEKAKQEYLIGEELSPIWWGDTINVFLAMGRDEEIIDIDDVPGINNEIRQLLHNLDDRALVLAKIQEFLNSNTSSYSSPAQMLYYAAMAAHIEEPALALSIMRTTLEDMGLNFYFLWFPVFEKARQHEDFKKLVEDFGLVSYWKKNGWPDNCQPQQDTFVCR